MFPNLSELSAVGKQIQDFLKDTAQWQADTRAQMDRIEAMQMAVMVKEEMQVPMPTLEYFLKNPLHITVHTEKAA